ncbi:MAG: homoserine O-acetyltransferase/O-succinyltransferase [Pseudonocardiales bacterium]|nr:alpha/beta hydrolase fold protein [Pseudonocardia sp.]MDT7650939.1 homoserine O-acetyltransferase/O-succinyltransferase [Pseudonocardiales bacterium]
MIENPFYSPEFHGDYDLVGIGRLDLEEGGSIPDCQLAVATFGELNEARDNAILVTTWYSGTHQIFRDVYIGPDHALNPDRYFIVCVNQIGSGLSTSPHNADGPNADIAMSNFPQVRIGDDVVAQERLLREHFGIEKLQLVVGGSMGAQQTYEWAVRFPGKVLRAAPIAGTAQNTPHDFLFTKALNEAITSDPGFAEGEYKSNADVVAGLRRHAGIWAVMGFSTEFWKQEGWRALEFESKEAFMEGFLEPYFTAMDPNDLLCLAWKWQRGDVARHTGGDLAAALGRITAKTFVIPIDEDMFFPVRDCRAEQELVPDSELRITEDILGHLGLFGVAPTFMAQIDRHLGELLATEV